MRNGFSYKKHFQTINLIKSFFLKKIFLSYFYFVFLSRTRMPSGRKEEEDAAERKADKRKRAELNKDSHNSKYHRANTAHELANKSLRRMEHN